MSLPPVGRVDDTYAVKWSVGIAEQLRALLGSPSDDPPLEVDANLRPEAGSGPLVRTLGSYAAYYAQWAQPWEVQASAAGPAGGRRRRPRGPVPGDGRPDALPRRRGCRPEAVLEIRRIKARVDAERLPRGADPNTHTKLGRGGLADVEWTVQLLQLRHAHEVAALHDTSTLKCAGRHRRRRADSAEADAAQLREAWLTATRARNALVLVRGKPTDQLPGPGRQLNAVAAAAGWPRTMAGSSWTIICASPGGRKPW